MFCVVNLSHMSESAQIGALMYMEQTVCGSHTTGKVTGQGQTIGHVKGQGRIVAQGI